MATATTNIARTKGGPTSLFGRIYRMVRVWRDYEETTSQLSKLSRRQLEDIGVEGDIHDLAKTLAERRNVL